MAKTYMMIGCNGKSYPATKEQIEWYLAPFPKETWSSVITPSGNKIYWNRTLYKP